MFQPNTNLIHEIPAKIPERICKQGCVCNNNTNALVIQIYTGTPKNRYPGAASPRQHGAGNSIRSRRESAYCLALTYITLLTRLSRVVSAMTFA